MVRQDYSAYRLIKILSQAIFIHPYCKLSKNHWPRKRLLFVRSFTRLGNPISSYTRRDPRAEYLKVKVNGPESSILELTIIYPSRCMRRCCQARIPLRPSASGGSGHLGILSWSLDDTAATVL